MVSIIDYITQGSRIFLTSWKHRFFPKHYPGSNAQEICKKIVDDCWNGTFFQTSTGNFTQFWTRDFGWCTASLLKLGYKEQVHKTLRYALNRFRQHAKITTTLTPGGKPFDFPTMAVDSLPWLIHSIRISKFPYYAYKKFLDAQIQMFYERVVNEHTGLVRPEQHFSSMKDLAVRKSSCYDNCMLGMLAQDLKHLKLHNPLAKFRYPELIKRHFWNGEYFYDDLSKQQYIAGDANIFPFVCGIIKDEKIIRLAVARIQEAGLDQPFPLKYTTSRENIKFVPEEFFLRNYESSAIWTHMGPLFVKLVQHIDPQKAAEYKKAYEEKILEHKNFLEVFDKNVKPFRTLFYYCDSGMLWAANYVTL